MEDFMALMSTLSDFVWGPYMIALVIATGVFLTFKLRFLQFTHLRFALKQTFGKLMAKPDGEGEISSYQALTTALSSCVGVGNIAGVATAIASGGPGAVFWMWISALFGMATKFSEITLSLRFRNKDESAPGPGFVLVSKS